VSFQTVSCIGTENQAHNNQKKHAHALKQQVAQLSQRDRAAGWVSYGKKWKTVTERQYFTDITDIIGLSSTIVT